MGPTDETFAEMLARHAMEALRFHWDGAYVFRTDGPQWIAERTDGLGVVTASGPGELAEAVQKDYRARPVPREPLG
jgi:hypothetical protein